MIAIVSVFTWASWPFMYLWLSIQVLCWFFNVATSFCSCLVVEIPYKSQERWFTPVIPAFGEADEEVSLWVWGHPGLQSAFMASLRLCSKAMSQKDTTKNKLKKNFLIKPLIKHVLQIVFLISYLLMFFIISLIHRNVWYSPIWLFLLLLLVLLILSPRSYYQGWDLAQWY